MSTGRGGKVLLAREGRGYLGNRRGDLDEVAVSGTPEYRSQRDAGFTLLELIVALVLLSLLLLVVPATVRLASRASGTAAALMTGDDREAAAGFLRQALSEAMPVIEPDKDGTLRVAFEGDAASTEFVAPLSSGPAGGGLYRVRLAFEPSNDGADSTLVMQLFTYGGATAGDGGAAVETRSIATGLGKGAFRYLGPSPGKTAAEWSETWARTNRLPDLVEISLVPRTGAGELSESSATNVRVELRLRKRT